MGRLSGALTVLILIAAVGITGFLINIRTARSVKEKLEDCLTLADQGNYSASANQLRNAKQEWDDKVEIMLLFESHGKLDEIEEAMNVAQSYIDKNEINLFYAKCRLAETLLEHYENVEYPNMCNIL